MRRERRNGGGEGKAGREGLERVEEIVGGGVVREECRHKTLMRKAYNAHLKLSPGELRGDLGEAAKTLKDEG